MTQVATLYVDLMMRKQQYDREADAAWKTAKKLQSTAIAPQVDTKALHDLNKLYDQKIAHHKQVGRFVSANPITPDYDGRNIVAGINQLREYKTELAAVKSQVGSMGVNVGTTINQRVTVDFGRYDTNMSYAIRSLHNDISKDFGKVVDAIVGLKPSLVERVASFAFKTVTAPVRLAAGVAGNAVGNIFTGYTEDIGRTMFDGMGRRQTVDFTNQIKKFARILDQEVVGRDKAYATFFAEFFRSGSIDKAFSRAIPRSEAGKIYDRLMKLQQIVTTPGNDAKRRIIREDPDLKKIFKQSRGDFRAFLENAQPRNLSTNIVNPIMEEFQPLLRFIQDIRAARTAMESDKVYNERKAAFPILDKYQSVVSVAGGAQFKGGQGGRNVAMGLEMLAPNAYFMPVENPDTDAALPGKELPFEKWFKEAIFAAIPGINGEFINTAVNGLRQVTTAFNPFGFSQAAAQGVANARLANEQGKQASFTSFSLGGMDAIAYANTQSYLGLNSPSLAMNYPFMNLANRVPNGFNAGVGVEDPLSFPMILGLGFNTGGVYQQSGGKAIGANAHHYKHILKNTEFLQLFFRTIGSEMPDIGSGDFGAIVEAGEKLYEIIGAAEQMKSLSETGSLNPQSPYHAFMVGNGDGVNVEQMLSKFFEWGKAISGMLKADSPEVKATGEALKNYFGKIQETVVQKLRDVGFPLPSNMDEMVGYQKYQSDVGQLNRWSGEMLAGINPKGSVVDLSGQVDEIQNLSIPWFKKSEQKSMFGEEYVNKIVAAYKNYITIAKEFIRTNGQLSDSFKEGFTMPPVNSYNQATDELLFKTRLNPFDLPKEEVARVEQLGVPRPFQQKQSAILAFNQLQKAIPQTLPNINQIQAIGVGMSGAASLIGQDLVYKTDLDPEGLSKVASENEVKAYEQLQGRLSPLLYQAVPGQALVAERIKGKPLKDILDRIARPIKELQEKQAKLREAIAQSQDPEEIRRLGQELDLVRAKAKTETARFNKAASILYKQVGQLGAALQQMGVVHNDLASGNVFFAQGGPVAIDLGNSQVVQPGQTTLTPMQRFGDFATSVQRSVIDRDYFGILNPLSAAGAIVSGYQNPLPIPQPRQINESLLTPAEVAEPIKLGTTLPSLLGRITGGQVPFSSTIPVPPAPEPVEEVTVNTDELERTIEAVWGDGLDTLAVLGRDRNQTLKEILAAIRGDDGGNGGDDGGSGQPLDLPPKRGPGGGYDAQAITVGGDPNGGGGNSPAGVTAGLALNLPDAKGLAQGLNITAWSSADAVRRYVAEMLKLEKAIVSKLPWGEKGLALLKASVGGLAIAGGMAEVGLLSDYIQLVQGVFVDVFNSIGNESIDVLVQNIGDDADNIIQTVRNIADAALGGDVTGPLAGIRGKINETELKIIQNFLDLASNAGEQATGLVDVTLRGVAGALTQIGGQAAGFGAAYLGLGAAGAVGGAVLNEGVKAAEVNPLITSTPDPSDKQSTPAVEGKTGPQLTITRIVSSKVDDELKQIEEDLRKVLDPQSVRDAEGKIMAPSNPVARVGEIQQFRRDTDAVVKNPADLTPEQYVTLLSRNQKFRLDAGLMNAKMEDEPDYIPKGSLMPKIKEGQFGDGRQIIRSLAATLESDLKNLLGITKKGSDIKAKLTAWADDVGIALPEGLLTGIKKGNLKENELQSVAVEVIDVFKKTFGIASPSKVFMEIGRAIVAGLAQGLDFSSVAKSVEGDVTSVIGDITKYFDGALMRLDVMGEDYAVNRLAESLENAYYAKTKTPPQPQSSQSKTIATTGDTGYKNDLSHWELSHYTDFLGGQGQMRNFYSFLDEGMKPVPNERRKPYEDAIFGASPLNYFAIRHKAAEAYDPNQEFGGLKIVPKIQDIATKGRSTWTPFDTGHYILSYAQKGMGEDVIPIIRKFVKDLFSDLPAPNELNKYTKELANEFIEVQVKGIIQPNEIESLHFSDPRSFNQHEFPHMIKRAQSYGIPVSGYYAGQSPDVAARIHPNYKTMLDLGVPESINKGMENGIDFALARKEIARESESVIDVARYIFKISSPSKVFMEIGENLVLGLTIGMKDIEKVERLKLSDVMGDDWVNIEAYASDLDKLTARVRKMDRFDGSAVEWLANEMTGVSIAADPDSYYKQRIKEGDPAFPAFIEKFLVDKIAQPTIGVPNAGTFIGEIPTSPAGVDTPKSVIQCPACLSVNPSDAIKCHVCGYHIGSDLPDVTVKKPDTTNAVNQNTQQTQENTVLGQQEEAARKKQVEAIKKQQQSSSTKPLTGIEAASTIDIGAMLNAIANELMNQIDKGVDPSDILKNIQGVNDLVFDGTGLTAMKAVSDVFFQLTRSGSDAAEVVGGIVAALKSLSQMPNEVLINAGAVQTPQVRDEELRRLEQEADAERNRQEQMLRQQQAQQQKINQRRSFVAGPNGIVPPEGRRTGAQNASVAPPIPPVSPGIFVGGGSGAVGGGGVPPAGASPSGGGFHGTPPIGPTPSIPRPGAGIGAPWAGSGGSGGGGSGGVGSGAVGGDPPDDNRRIMERARDWVSNRVAQIPDSGITSFLRNLNDALDNVESAAEEAGIGIRGIGQIINELEQKHPGLGRIVSTLKDVGVGVLFALGLAQVDQLIVDFGRASIDAAVKVERFKVALSYSTSGGVEGLKRIRDLSGEIGANFLTVAENYSKLTVAAAGTNIAPQVENITVGFTKALTAQGASPEEQSRAFLAVQQMIGKGQIMAEELRQQLAEVMPQVTGALARSKGMTQQQLVREMKTSALLPEEDLLPLAKQLEIESTIPLATFRSGPLPKLANIQNQTQQIQAGFGEGLLKMPGVLDAISGAATLLAKSIEYLTTAVAAAAVWFGGRALLGLMAFGSGTRIVTVLLKAMGLEFVTNNFLLGKWNNTIGAVFPRMQVAAQGAGAALLGVGSGILNITKALLPFAAFGSVIYGVQKGFQAWNTELRQVAKEAKKSADELQRIADIELNPQTQQQQEKNKNNFGLNQGANNPLARLFLNMTPVGFAGALQRFDASRGIENLFGLNDFADEKGNRVGFFDRISTLSNRGTAGDFDSARQSTLEAARALMTPDRLSDLNQQLKQNQLAQLSIQARTSAVALTDPTGQQYDSLLKESARLSEVRMRITEDYAKVSANLEYQIKGAEQEYDRVYKDTADPNREQRLQEISAHLVEMRTKLAAINDSAAGINANTRMLNAISEQNKNLTMDAEANNKLMFGQARGEIGKDFLAGNLNAVEYGLLQQQLAADEARNRESIAFDSMNNAKTIFGSMDEFVERSRIILNDPKTFNMNLSENATAEDIYKAVSTVSPEKLDQLLQDESFAQKDWAKNAREYVAGLHKFVEVQGETVNAVSEATKAQAEINKRLRDAQLSMRSANTSARNIALFNSGKIGDPELQLLEADAKRQAARQALENAIKDQQAFGADPIQTQEAVNQANLALADAERNFIQSQRQLQDGVRNQAIAIEDYNQSVFDNQLQFARQLRDTQWEVEDAYRNMIRQSRDLQEAWTDLIFGLDTKLLEAQIELENSQDELGRVQRRINIEQISPFSENYGRKAATIVADYLDALDGNESEARNLQKEQRAIGEEYVTTLRSIRGEVEKQYDAELERNRTLIRLNERYMDLIMSVDKAVRDMERRAVEMTLNIERNFPSFKGAMAAINMPSVPTSAAGVPQQFTQTGQPIVKYGIQPGTGQVINSGQYQQGGLWADEMALPTAPPVYQQSHQSQTQPATVVQTNKKPYYNGSGLVGYFSDEEARQMGLKGQSFNPANYEPGNPNILEDYMRANRGESISRPAPVVPDLAQPQPVYQQPQSSNTRGGKIDLPHGYESVEGLVNTRLRNNQYFNLDSPADFGAMGLAIATAATEAFGYGTQRTDWFTRMGGSGNQMKGFGQAHQKYHAASTSNPDSYMNWIGAIFHGQKQLPNAKGQADFAQMLADQVQRGQIQTGADLIRFTQAGGNAGLAGTSSGFNWQGLADGWGRNPGLADWIVNWLKENLLSVLQNSGSLSASLNFGIPEGIELGRTAQLSSDAKGAGLGLLGGAAVGATAGSFIPGVGNILGGIIGAGFGAAGGSMIGTYKPEWIDSVIDFTKELNPFGENGMLNYFSGNKKPKVDEPATPTPTPAAGVNQQPQQRVIPQEETRDINAPNRTTPNLPWNDPNAIFQLQNSTTFVNQAYGQNRVGATITGTGSPTVTDIAPIQINDPSEAYELANRQLVLKQAVLSVKGEIVNAKNIFEEAKFLNSVQNLRTEMENKTRELGRQVEDEQSFKIPQMREDAKGYLTDMESVNRVGREVAKTFVDMNRTWQDRDIALGREINGAVEQIAKFQSMIDSGKDEAGNALSPEGINAYRQVIGVLQDHIPALDAQRKALKANNDAMMAMEDSTRRAKMELEALNKVTAGQQAYADILGSFFQTRYDVGATNDWGLGTLINKAPIVKAEMDKVLNAKKLEELRRQNILTGESFAKVVEMQKEIDQLNIDRAFVQAIPGLEAFSSELKNVILESQNLGEAARKMGNVILGLITDQLVIKPLQNWIAKTVGPLLGFDDPSLKPVTTTMGTGFAFETAAAIAKNNIVPFTPAGVTGETTSDVLAPFAQANDAVLGLSETLDVSRISQEAATVGFTNSLAIATQAVLTFAGALNTSGGSSLVSSVVSGGSSLLGGLFTAANAATAFIPTSGYTGATLPLPNFADGGAISEAMNRERIQSGGKQPILAVINTDEYVIPADEGAEYLNYRQWKNIKANDVKIKNFAGGGFVDSRKFTANSQSNTSSGSTNNFYNNTTIQVQNPNDIGMSARQIERQRKLNAERNMI